MKKTNIIMKNYFNVFTIIILLMMVIISCKTNLEQTSAKEKKQEIIIVASMPGPPAIVYKTKKDYFNLVPVILSDDKSKIVSYPAVSDIKIGGEYTYPTKLFNDYLLDNRGITKNVAFLSLTYEEYGKLEKTPAPEELFKKIIDNDPLMEIYKCGLKSDYKNIVEEINQMIQENKLKME